MGIIRAAVNAVHGSFADQWLETVEPYEMGEHTVFTEGILVRKGQNKKGSQTISNGSVILSMTISYDAGGRQKRSLITPRAGLLY